METKLQCIAGSVFPIRRTRFQGIIVQYPTKNNRYLFFFCCHRAPFKEVVNYELDLPINIESLFTSSGYKCTYKGNVSTSCYPCPLGTFEGAGEECIACPAGDSVLTLALAGKEK